MEVLLFLKNWLEHHILETDKLCSEFLIEKGVRWSQRSAGDYFDLRMPGHIEEVSGSYILVREQLQIWNQL